MALEVRILEGSTHMNRPGLKYYCWRCKDWVNQFPVQHGIKNGLALPMVMHRELVGLILVGSQHRVLSYTQETQQLAAALADQAAVAVV